MRLERGTWTIIGWLLLIFGGWAHNAQAQQVPSRDVGKSTYYVPVFPGGSVNVHPYFANFKYSLPFFKASGVGPATSFGITYNTSNLISENPGFAYGWTCEYFMRMQPVGDTIIFNVPWGDEVHVFESGGEFKMAQGFGFNGKFAPVANQDYHWILHMDGGTIYTFKQIIAGSSVAYLRNIIDPAGNRTDLVYENGKLTKIVDMVPPNGPFGVGRETLLAYYDDPMEVISYGRFKRITDPAGNAYDFVYTMEVDGVRLTSVLFPPIVVEGVSKRPTYKFQYTNGGLITKVIPPRGAEAGNYGYGLQYQGTRLLRVTDPPVEYVTEGGTTTTGSPQLFLEYFNQGYYGQKFTDANKPTNTVVIDRRGRSTVYVFDEASFGTQSYLLSEIWDHVALSGNPDIGNNIGGVPGVFPVLTEFDQYFNLTKVQDRWGNRTEYEFLTPQAPMPGWIHNLVKTVKRPGPTGLVTVEEFTYTQDVFANIETRTTYAQAGVARTTTNEYDLYGRITRIRHPNVSSIPGADPQVNITSEFVYETAQRRQLKQQKNERGNWTYYQQYHPVHGLPEVTTRDGGAGLFETQYDAMGNPIATRQPQGGINNDPTNWEYTHLDSRYRVRQVVDALGIIAIEKEYDLDGNLVKELPAGDLNTPAQAVLTFYDKRRFVTGGSGPDGSWSQMVDAHGNVRRRTSLRGYTTTSTYDDLNRLLTVVTPGASVYGAEGGGGVAMTDSFQYDVFDPERGRLCDTVTRGARVTKTFYDLRRRKDLVVSPDGVTASRTVYDEQDQVVATEALYDSVLQSSVVTFRDERDRVYRTRVQSTAYSPGQAPALYSDMDQIRNAAGTVVEERDPVGHLTTYEVDQRERVVKVFDGLGVEVVRNIYGDDNLLIEVRVPDPATKSAALATQKTQSYTARKELKEVRNRDNVRVGLNEYRVRNGVIDQVTNAAGVVTKTTYHPATWRVNEVIVALGTADERRTKSVWADGLLAEVQVWNPAPGGGYAAPARHLYFYDEADRLEVYTCPGNLLAPERTFYTEFGEVDKVIAGSRTVDHTYNILGQLTETLRTRPSVYSELETRTYGPTGLLTSASNADRSETTAYQTWLGTVDVQDYFVGGLRWNSIVPGNEDIPALDYTFDPAKFLRFLRDPQQGTHEWRYDANGRLFFSGYGAFGQSIQPVSTITYTPGGLVDTTTTHDAAGIPIATTTFSYDGRGRRKRQRTVQSSTGTVLADLEWDFSDLDLVTRIRFHHLGVESSIGYNDRQEVESENITSNGGGLTPPSFSFQTGTPSWSTESVPSAPEVAVSPGPRLGVAARSATYVIDPAGNRTSQTIDGVLTIFTYNSASQLHLETRVSAQTDEVEHFYDEWGNEASRATDLGNNGSIDKTESYQYNELNLLSLYTNTATSANWQYEYWPGGARFSKTDQAASPSPVSEIYILKMGDVGADYEQAGVGAIALKNTYVQGITTDSKQLRITAAGERRYYVGDAVGTVSVTLSDNGTVEQTSFKDVFGVDLTAPLSGERYSGLAQRERDTESGLDYVRARMYDPRLGRFTQTDPLLASRAIEHYVYGFNNPVSMVDPQGLYGWRDFWEDTKAFAVGAGQGIVNVGEALYDAGKGIVNAVAHPLDTADKALYAIGETVDAIERDGVGNVLSNAAGGLKVQFQEDPEKFLAKTAATLTVAALGAAAPGAVASVPGAVGGGGGATLALAGGGTVATATTVVVVVAPAVQVGAAALAVAMAEAGGEPGSAAEGAATNKPTPRANRRKAMREADIPTSQQPVKQQSVKTPEGKPAGRQYTYEVPKEGGGTQTKSVQHSLTDDVPGHGSHWEAGTVKPGRTDGLGRPRLTSDKKKVDD